MHSRHFLALLTAALIATAVPAASSAAAPTADGYIVVLREGSNTDLIAREQAARYGFDVSQLYHTALNGYAAPFQCSSCRASASRPERGLRLA